MPASKQASKPAGQSSLHVIFVEGKWICNQVGPKGYKIQLYAMMRRSHPNAALLAERLPTPAQGLYAAQTQLLPRTLAAVQQVAEGGCTLHGQLQTRTAVTGKQWLTKQDTTPQHSTTELHTNEQDQ